MIYKVVEKFTSINGEGGKAGELAVFIRFAGCNLRCSYCDTLWANEANVPCVEMAEKELYDDIKETGIKNITLTGGEPLLQKGIDELLCLLASDGSLRVEVETNGSVDLEQFREISAKQLVFTVDYKLPSSGMEAAMKVSNFGCLKPQDTVKFVVGSMHDLEKARAILAAHGLVGRCSVHFSPVFGKINLDTMVTYMKDHKMNGVRLQPQLHKIIWHPDTRGV